MTKRKSISKKIRFDIFKRDGFKCMYCGGHPPSVILHVDHIHPVAEGGSNEHENLITSCAPCNLGKGARLLSVVPETLVEKMTALAEREAQLIGYQEILENKRDRIEFELWEVAEVIKPRSSTEGMNRKWVSSIQMFNERLGFYVVSEAAEVARNKYAYGGEKTFLYFCGVCWNLVRKQEAI